MEYKFKDNLALIEEYYRVFILYEMKFRDEGLDRIKLCWGLIIGCRNNRIAFDYFVKFMRTSDKFIDNISCIMFFNSCVNAEIGHDVHYYTFNSFVKLMKSHGINFKNIEIKRWILMHFKKSTNKLTTVEIERIFQANNFNKTRNPIGKLLGSLGYESYKFSNERGWFVEFIK